MLYEPRSYQKFTTTKILENNKQYPVVGMGLGKTVSTLTALNDMLYDQFLDLKVLIIAPLRVAQYTWPEEIHKWDHLKLLSYSLVLGKATDRIKALNTDADLYIINRENTQWLVDYCLTNRVWPFKMLVIDEASSFKSSKALRFRALRKVCGLFERVVLLSGTPTPNDKIDIWSQIYLMDKGERLGTTKKAFQTRFFYPGRSNGHIVYEYLPKPGSEAQISSLLSDVTFSLSEEDYLDLPERIFNNIEVVMPPAVEKVYKQLKRDLILEISDDVTVNALMAITLQGKLLQLANGCVYDTNKLPVHIHDLKLDALEEIIEFNEGQPILVMYSYTSDRDRIFERFAKLKPRRLSTQQDIDDWNAGKIQLLVEHPASIGHGLNLQAGGHILVWFGLPNNLEYYLQTNKRLHRHGQVSAVIVHHIITKGTVDEQVLASLQSKGATQESFINSFKAFIESERERNN